jgi:hypothetical protein
MEQAGEVDDLITWRDNEFVGRVSLTPCRRAGANRRCFAFPKSPSCLRVCGRCRRTQTGARRRSAGDGCVADGDRRHDPGASRPPRDWQRAGLACPTQSQGSGGAGSREPGRGRPRTHGWQNGGRHRDRDHQDRTMVNRVHAPAAGTVSRRSAHPARPRTGRRFECSVAADLGWVPWQQGWRTTARHRLGGAA